MTQYTKPTVLPAWAESAGGADVLQPSNTEIQAGWPLSNVPPSRKRFNWVLKYLAQGVRYLMQRGIPEWDSAEDYRIGDRVQGSDGKTYKCIQAGTNQNPTTATTYWSLWGTEGRDDQLQLTTAFTTAGTAGTFTLSATSAPTALAANLRFRVKFHAAGTGTDTINVNALGAKSIKQYDRAGAKVSAVITANQLADIEYDGVDFVILDPLPTAGGQQIFTANGTFTVPAGVSRIFVTLVGGGGGGAGAINGAAYTPGGGGGGGVYYRSPVSVTPGQAIAVTIGSGGAGGIGSGYGGTYASSNGASGGASSFGAFLTASGGSGGNCQVEQAYGGAAGGAFASKGESGSINTDRGGNGGSNIFGPGALYDHGNVTSGGYGGGGPGGRASGYWRNGNNGSSGLCIVEW